MRIVIITISFPLTLQEDPPFPASWELARALKKAGHEVLVVTFGRKDSLESDGTLSELEGLKIFRKVFDWVNFPGVQCPPYAQFNFVAGQALTLYEAAQTVIEDFAPDVIECQEFNGLGFYWAVNHRYPLVIRCYGPLSTLMRNGLTGECTAGDTDLVGALELATLSEADAIVSICGDIANVLSEQSGIPKEQFKIIRTPYSAPDQLQLAESFTQAKPEEFQYAADAFPKLFFLARVVPQKGAHVLLEALPKIAERFPKFQIAIAGFEGIEMGGSEPYANYMRAKLRDLGLLDRVEFLGFAERDLIKRKVHEADLSLFPSLYETACYACIEAMSYGGCVVASQVGGLPEYVSHGQDGWLFKVGDAEQFAKAIIQLSEDSELRLRIKRDSAKSIYVKCNPEQICRESIEIYTRAIAHFEQNRASRRTLKILSNSIQALVKEKAFSDYKHSMLRKQEEASNALETLRQQQETLHQQKETLLQQQETFRQTIKELSAQNGRLRNKLNSIRSHAEAQESTIEELRNSKVRLREEFLNLSKTSRALQETLAEQEVQIRNWKISNQDLSSIINHQSDQLNRRSVGFVLKLVSMLPR